MLLSKQLRAGVVSFLFFTLLTGVIYPLVVTGLAQLLFPGAANGSLIVVDGKNVGSALVGQSFTGEAYFWGRPSATSGFPYNAAVSSGSNYGPLHPDLLAGVQARLEALQTAASAVADPTNTAPVPVDLVTASGSGLDPHISPAATEYQVNRVAKARGMDVTAVRALVAQYTESPQWGVFGEPRVNVLQLNLALNSE